MNKEGYRATFEAIDPPSIVSPAPLREPKEFVVIKPGISSVEPEGWIKTTLEQLNNAGLMAGLEPPRLSSNLPRFVVMLSDPLTPLITLQDLNYQ